MKLSQFDFELPEELLVSTPSTPRYRRDECRMLVLHKDTGEIEHKQFKDITTYFNPGDVFVFNDTKVLPAVLKGNKEKTGADIEVTLLRELNRDQKLWDVLVEPARKIRIGNKLYFGEDGSFVAEVVDNTTSRGRILRFLFDGDYDEFHQMLYDYGSAPVPKFVKKDTTPDDLLDYQTIYAAKEGAVSAPAAGFHFTRSTFLRMELADIEKAFVTLHMSICHFKDVDVEDLSKHRMESEHIIIDEDNAEIINKAKRAGHKILGVGVTTARTLESSVTTSGLVVPCDKWTDKFIFPQYNFSVMDAYLTNFHLPKSTMIMNVAAFGGHENVMKAYREAVEHRYEFGPYGDAMLIL